MNAERGRRAAAVLPTVRAVGNVEDDAIGDDGDRTEAGRRLGAVEFKTAPTPDSSAFVPATSLFVERRADETIDTDDAFGRAVEAIGLDGEKSGVVVCTVRGPSITPPTTLAFVQGMLKEGHVGTVRPRRSKLSTRSERCLVPLGDSWLLLAQGGLVGDTLNAVIFVIGSNDGPLKPIRSIPRSHGESDD